MSLSLILVLGAAVLAVGVTFLFSRQQVVEALDEWERFESQSLRKINTYREIREEMGFAGLIHNFKNYLLRKDSTYQEATYRHAENLRRLILQYRQLAPTDDEQQALDVILELVNENEGSMAVAESLFETGIPLEAIDLQVQFDEVPATEALELLSSYALKEREEGEQLLVGRLEASIDRSARLGTAVVVTFTLALLVFGLGMRASLRRMEATRDALNSLAAGQDDVEIRYVEERNEIGDLARAAVQFRAALTGIKENSQALEATNAELETTLEQLETTMEKAVQAEKLASLGQLVTGVAHEINTPLGVAVTAASVMQGSARQILGLHEEEKLSRSRLERSMREMLEAADLLNDNLSRASRLVVSFREVAADQHSDVPRNLILGEFMERLMDSLRSQATPSIGMETEYEEEASFQTYPGVLSQVITQLVLNAVSHAFPDQRSGTITVVLQPTADGQLMLECRDDGVGIHPEKREKVFDPFYTTSRGTGRAGLGLHVVYNQVTTVLKGTIECTAGERSGTVFRALIPPASA